MDPLNPLFAAAALSLALLAVYLLNRRAPTPVSHRFVAIDGLRGYLAFFVFMHHSALWYFYLRTGRWENPDSRVFTHFGQIGVALFFMITGLLFFTKLLEGRARPIDWLRLFTSRVLRLTPLYLLVVLLLFAIVALLSDFSLRVPLAQLVKVGMEWLTFSLLGGHPLNGIAETSLIVAQVTWSLVYEWMFYLSLPVLALTVRTVPPLPYLMLSGICVILWLWLLTPAASYIGMFFGGIAAAIVVRNPVVRRYLQTRIATCAAIACLIWVALSPVSPHIQLVSVPLLALPFGVFAAGNDLFGILSSRVSRQLGELSYSLYLLHGMLLFVVFRFILGYPQARELTPLEHWGVVLCCSPLLILICHYSYRLVELPPNRAVPAVTRWLQTRLVRAAPRSVLPT